MDNRSIAHILRAHNIPYYIKDGHLYADTMESHTLLYERVEDLTGISKENLFNWLGY